MSEVGEGVDEVLDLINAGSDDDTDAIKRRIGLEIYDIIWSAVDLANLLAIDLNASFAEKTARNRDRIWRRSGKLKDDSQTS